MNLFLGASSQSSDALFDIVKNSLITSGIQQDFNFIGSTNANRVKKRQLHIVHKVSRIRCSLQFESDDLVQISSKIISKYMRYATGKF